MLPQRFTEKEIALLYEHTEAPYLFDALVQGVTPDPSLGQKVHEIMGRQSPDVALLSLCLCGLVVARDLRLRLIEQGEAAEDLRPLCAELDTHAHESLYALGRLWLDTVVFELDVNPINGLRVLRDIPTNLQVMTSIFGELRDMLPDEDPMRSALNILYYQGESHADAAEAFVSTMFEPQKRMDKRAMPTAQATIPLPLDIQEHAQEGGAKVIPFSVFAARSRERSTK